MSRLMAKSAVLMVVIDVERLRHLMVLQFLCLKLHRG